eukprot:3802858-Pyramimonas_sp.AAC.1
MEVTCVMRAKQLTAVSHSVSQSASQWDIGIEVGGGRGFRGLTFVSRENEHSEVVPEPDGRVPRLDPGRRQMLLEHRRLRGPVVVFWHELH